MNVTLLLISADPNLRASAESEARQIPVPMRVVPSPQQAAKLRTEHPDEKYSAVMIDLLGGNRDEAFQWSRKVFPGAQVALLIPTERFSGFSPLTTPNPPQGWRSGADFLLARAWDRDGFRQFVARLSQTRELGERAVGARGLDELIGRSVPFRDALETATTAVGEKHVPVLITGERGVGKRVFARAIHADSYGSHESFLHIDCTAVSGKAFDAALQGEALTAGAAASAPISSEGTLFLEEVAALDANRQAKVLAYLAESYHGLGSDPQRRKGKPRLITATARSLEEAVKQDKFNRALYTKLNTLRITIPPLRERPSDTLLLAERFLSQKALKQDAAVPTLAREVQERLLAHPWPGNIRELLGVLEAAMEAAEGGEEIRPEHMPDWLQPLPEIGLPRHLQQDGEPGDASGTTVRMCEGNVIVELPEDGMPFEEIERAILTAALRQTNNNVVRAAKLLRLGRGSLRYRLEKYGLVDPKRRRSAKRRTPAIPPEGEEGLRRAS